MRVLKTSLFVAAAMSVVLFSSCENDLGIDQPDVVVPGSASATAFTVSLSAKINGVSKEELAFAKGGVLLCKKTDDAESIFRSWKNGNDEPEGCYVFQDGRLAGGEYNGVIKSLYPDTEYSYCIYLKNKDNSLREISDVFTFRTTPLNPEYQSFSVASIRMFSAVVTGKVIINSTDLNYSEWGLMVCDKEDGKLSESVRNISYMEQEPGAVLQLSALYLSPSTDYWYRPYISYHTYDNLDHVYYGPESKFTTLEEENWGVNLGLPSGILWSKAILGIQDFDSAYDLLFTNPYQCYWGSLTVPQSDNAPYEYWDAKNKNYVNIGNNIEGTQYDVAHVVMGGKWRLPTKADVEELMRYCKVGQIEERQYYYNTDEYSIRLHASLVGITGPNGRRIDTFGNAIWTGTMSENGVNPYSVICRYNSQIDSVYLELCDTLSRDNAFTIRPVWDPNM